MSHNLAGEITRPSERSRITWTVAGLTLVLLLGVIATTPRSSASGASPARGPLLWSEDFTPSADCTTDCRADTRRWSYDRGGGGWGNDEWQEYTTLPENSLLTRDGTLQITLRSTPTHWTSARLVTRDKVAVGFGYVEARIKLPAGRQSGVWPAFWLRSNGESWPDGGEIDVLETINGNAGHSTTIHGGGTHHWQNYRWHPSTAVNDGRWHTYGVLIRSDRLTFYHDGKPVHTITSAQTPAGGVWPFSAKDRRYYMILNVAMGGSYPGPPDGTATLPLNMHVDYVRYWALPGTTGPANWLGSPKVTPKIALSIPPATLRANRRPRVRVTVTRQGRPYGGRARITVAGRTVQTVSLPGGRRDILLPRLRPGRHRLVVEYLGNMSTGPTSVVRTIQVRR